MTKFGILVAVLALTTSLSYATNEDQKYICLHKIIDASREGTQFDMSGLENIADLLLYYSALPDETRAKIDACSLNLAPAIKRCENINGAGACQAVTTTFANKKCQPGFKIEGCCQCVVSCPSNWEDRGYWCMKPKVVNAETCPDMFERIGKNTCVPRCPLGWNDQGPRCQKPRNSHIGHPFIWTRGDN